MQFKAFAVTERVPPPPSTLALADDELLARMVPDPAFTAALETRLQRAHLAQVYAQRPLRQRIALWPRLSPRFALGILLAMLSRPEPANTMMPLSSADHLMN